MPILLKFTWVFFVLKQENISETTSLKLLNFFNTIFHQNHGGLRFMADVHTRETRAHEFLRQVSLYRNLFIFNESFSVVGCRPWNGLPEDLVITDLIVSLKLKIFLL